MTDRIHKYQSRLKAVSKRLKNVSLESRDAVEVAESYGANPSVCIYADPPYLGSTRADNYRLEMLEDDLHTQLSDVLNNVKASVVLDRKSTRLNSSHVAISYAV